MFHHTHWMSVFTTTYEDEAHMIAGELEANGIMTRLHQDLSAGKAGKITVMVDDRDYDQASAILSRTLLEVVLP